MKKNVSGCSIKEAMRVVGGRWRLLLVSYLLDGSKRFNQLRRDMPQISHRVLTLELRVLEAEGLIERTVYPQVPPCVEYRLRGQGEHLRPLVEAVKTFGLWLKARGDDDAAGR